MLAPVLITPPASDPVSLSDAKAHLRVEHSEDDALIGALIKAATAHLDGWTGILGRALVTQTWRQDYERFGGVMLLRLSPVISVTSVAYVDVSGQAATVPAGNYDLVVSDLGPFIAPKPGVQWPATGDVNVPVSVTFVCGTAAADVPAPIRAAILLMVGDLYRNRETVAIGAVASAIPMAPTVAALLAPYRRVGV